MGYEENNFIEKHLGGVSRREQEREGTKYKAKASRGTSLLQSWPMGPLRL
jgi:hypothetical protein